MSFDYSKLATLRPKLKEEKKEDTEITGVITGVMTPVKTPAATPVITPVETPVITPVETPVITGVTTPVKTPVTTPVTTPAATPVTTPVITPVTTPVTGELSDGPTEAAASLPEYLDATHTGSEQKIYSVMYRHVRERHWGFQELSKLTGIRSDQTIRRAIDGLVAKLSIEIVSYQHGSPLGPRYRIFVPKEILQRRRRAGLEIDSQTKRIETPVTTPVTTPAATPVTTPVVTGVITPVVTGGKNHGSTPVKITGVSLNIKENHDDDSAPLIAALRRLAPDDGEENSKAAARDILDLVVAELDAAAERATVPPASARFGVECVRRALRRGDRPKRARETASEPPPPAETDEPAPGSVYAVRRLAAQLFEAHRGEPGFDRERLRALVDEALQNQRAEVDSAIVDEAIHGMGN